MHYILNADNYISAVSFGCDIECADGYCQEYTGSVPAGYTSLEAWYAAEGEKLYRWKIVNGQLTKDDEAAPPAPDKPPYAPEGYGLGEAAGQLVTDCDAAVLSGWYQLGEYTLNAPDAEGHLMMVSACAGCIYQEVFADGGTVTRWCKSGTWDEWEWVNPPMLLGVEYRTTERYKGKPVYAKSVDLGAMPNTTYKLVAHGIADLDDIIDVRGTATNGSSRVFIPSTVGSMPMEWNIGLVNASIVVVTGSDASKWYGSALVKFTKTTD